MKKFKKILRFFDHNLYGKLTFFSNFHEIFLLFLPLLRKDRPLEGNTIFLRFFSVSAGGGRSPVPPPYATGYGIVMV